MGEHGKGDEMIHKLTITPAIKPEERHKIEDILKEMGYHVIGGGTDMDMSECDISFEDSGTEEGDAGMVDIVHLENGKWWFWGELRDIRYGPYDTEEICRDMLKRYAMLIEGWSLIGGRRRKGC